MHYLFNNNIINRKALTKRKKENSKGIGINRNERDHAKEVRRVQAHFLIPSSSPVRKCLAPSL